MVHYLELHQEGKVDQTNLDKKFLKAVENEDVLEAQILLKMGADIHYTDSREGLSALTFAIKNKDYAMMRLLRQYNAPTLIGHDLANFSREERDFYRSYQDSLAALFEAVRTQNLESVSQALKRGANINGVLYGNTPLKLAMLGTPPNLDLIRLLVKHGADIDQIVQGQAVNQTPTTRNVKRLLNRLQTQNFMLMKAAKKGNLAGMRRALQQGASIHFQNKNKSILDRAINGHHQAAIEYVKDELSPRRTYIKQAIGATRDPKNWEDFTQEKEHAVEYLQEKDPHFLGQKHQHPSAAKFSSALSHAHKNNIKGEGTHILVIEWHGGEWQHPDFKGIITGDNMSAHGISVTSVVYEMAPAVACAVASPTEIRHCFKPSAAERDAFCQKIRKNTVINASFVSSPADREHLKELFIKILGGTDNVLVIAIGNEPHSYRKVVDHFWLLDQLFQAGFEHRIIVAGGIKADYSNAYYVKPNVLDHVPELSPGFEKKLQSRFLCALAKDVPARTERGYGKVNGTSFAAPAITGAIALLKSSNPGLGYSTIMRILLDTGRKNFHDYRADDYGQGVLNLEDALEQTLKTREALI